MKEIDLYKIPKLKVINCSNSGVEKISNFHNNLIELNCSFNNLEFLPELPTSLKKLNCIGNKLPYNNLNEYKKFVDNNKDSIKQYGIEVATKLVYSTIDLKK